MSVIGRTSMPGVSIGTMISLMPGVGRPVRRRAADQVAVVGDGAEARPDLLPVDHEVVAVAHGAVVASDGQVGARVRARSCRCTTSSRRTGCRAGTRGCCSACRRRSASGPSGGRRTTSPRSARRRRSAPRRRSAGRSAGRPPPPNSTGQVMPIQPVAASSRANSFEKPLIHESLWRPYLATASAANERASSRRARCSGVQAKSTALHATERRCDEGASSPAGVQQP